MLICDTSEGKGGMRKALCLFVEVRQLPTSGKLSFMEQCFWQDIELCNISMKVFGCKKY